MKLFEDSDQSILVLVPGRFLAVCIAVFSKRDVVGQGVLKLSQSARRVMFFSDERDKVLEDS
jgi:hypothetical protein